MRKLSIGKNSVTDWSSFCRAVCQFWLEQRSETLGGAGSVVEIRQLENTPTLLVLSVEPLGKSSISGICVDKHTESQSAL